MRPESAGRLTAAAWLTYANEFKLAYARLESPMEEEAWHWVLAQVPDRLCQGVIREERRRNSDRPMVRLTGFQGVPLEDIRGLLGSAIGDLGLAALVTIVP